MNDSDIIVVLVAAIGVFICLASMYRERAIEAEPKLAELQHNEEGTWKD